LSFQIGEPPSREALEQVYRRGYQLRRRRRSRRAAAVLIGLQLVMALPALFLADGDGDTIRTIASSPTTSTSTSTSTTSTTALVLGEVTTTTVPGAPTTTTLVPASTTTTRPSGPTTTTRPAVAATTCRNSTDPKCGPFYWDPQPNNSPTRIEVRWTPEHPRVGEKVTFTIRTIDEDAPNLRAWCDDDGKNPRECGSREPGPCPSRYGPWTPPAPEKLDTAVTKTQYERTVTYDSPGEKEFNFTRSSAMKGFCTGPDPNDPYKDDPYRGTAEILAKIVVAPAE
jgi:hypothetical protein